MSESETREFSKVLSLPIQVTPPGGGTVHREQVPELMELYARLLISKCAYRICFPRDVIRAVSSPAILKKQLTPSIRKRVFFVDRNNSQWNAVENYLKPVKEALISKDFWPFEGSVELNKLALELYFLILSVKEECEVGLSPSNTLKLINQLKNMVDQAGEGISRLSILEGLFRLLLPRKDIPDFEILPNKAQFALVERINDIIEDSYLLEASWLRRFFGIRSNISALKQDLNKLMRFIVKSRPWAKGILAVKPHIASFGTNSLKAIDILMSAIPELHPTTFSPVILDSDSMRYEFHRSITTSLFEVAPLLSGGIRLLSFRMEQDYQSKWKENVRGWYVFIPELGKGKISGHTFEQDAKYILSQSYDRHTLSRFVRRNILKIEIKENNEIKK